MLSIQNKIKKKIMSTSLGDNIKYNGNINEKRIEKPRLDFTALNSNI